jgi:hypothetical protein
MKNNILKSISLIFHPLIMPILGVLIYFSKSPRFIPEITIKAKLFSIGILTVILPILLFYLLKTINKINSFYLETTKERILPLILNSAIIFLILNKVMTQNEIPELYYFFLGILYSTITCLILAVLKFKASIHMIAAAGVFMFVIAIGIHFKVNSNGIIGGMCIVMGAIATSRLHLKAHTPIELIFGFFIGLIPQLVLLNYWL